MQLIYFGEASSPICTNIDNQCINTNDSNNYLVKNIDCKVNLCPLHSFCFLGSCVCHPGYTNYNCDEKIKGFPFNRLDCPNLLMNDTIQLDFISILEYVEELIYTNKEKDIQLFELQEKLDYKTKELKEYENILCFHSSDSDDEDDSLKDLNSLKEKENEKEYENILNNCSEEIREEKIF
jgi:hypothetical protein